MTIVKEIVFAYPTSETAARLGRAEGGCWLIRSYDRSNFRELDRGTRPVNTSGPYASRAEAEREAMVLPGEFSSSYLASERPGSIIPAAADLDAMTAWNAHQAIGTFGREG